MRTVYVKAPFQFDIREVPRREPGRNEVLIKIRACGICGTDLHTARSEAHEWQPCGHEIAGIVEKIGDDVTHVSPGDTVTLETGTYDRFSNNARNGRVDLDNNGPNFWLKGPMGFSDYITVPRETVVPYTGLSFLEAAQIEPLGVAFDLVYTADIRINDDVLIVGLGPIGLLALQLARLMGARRVFAAQRSRSKKRVELARTCGADDVIETDKQDITTYAFPRGGVERVLVTAPPEAIPATFQVCAVGAIVAFIGIAFGGGETISFDANHFHFTKLQLRSSFASPALYFPTCIELAQSGKIELEPLVTSTFHLEEIEQAMKALEEEKASAVKSIMVAEEGM
jgi:L-iditol 2-dehydrogenase